MILDDARTWLDTHREHINSFMDYEVYFESADEILETLTSWFDAPPSIDGHSFDHLGSDGTGSMFLLWTKEGRGEKPVVLLGSEGSFGVMTRDLKSFIQALSFAPSLDEEYDQTPSSLSDVSGTLEFLADEGETDALADAKKNQGEYHAAVMEQFGSVPTFEALTDGVDSLNQEFMAFIVSNTA